MLKSLIKKDLQECWEALEYEYSDNYYVEVPKNPEHGDFSTNAALANAKNNRLKPLDMAAQIVELLKKKRHYKSVSIAGNGFINFVLANNRYHKTLIDIFEAGDKYGQSEYGEGKKVLIEFVSANPTGPLNVVNARAAAYGDTLYKIMNYAGFKAKREYYINDSGNQVDVLAESLELRYREILGEDIGELPPGTYQGEYVKDLALKLRAKEGTKIMHYSEADKLEKMKEFALEEIHEMQYSSLEKFGVEFDSWVSEKMLRSQGVIEEVLSYLAEANCTYESEEAVWFASSKYGDEKDRVLMKSDGEITYFVPDLAYHLTKYHRGFDHIIDVLGPDHHGYVPRLTAAMRALQFDETKLEIIFLQQVNLFEGGEKVKMSKRTGNIITMDELIDEVGVDAARYFFLEKKPSAHLNFDLELAKKESSENPVYYCQYAHARICSVMKRAKKEKVNLKDFNTKDLTRLKSAEEIALIKKMVEFPELLVSASVAREPHRLAFYTYDLATLFHRYYQKYQVLNSARPELSKARLYLLTAVKETLAIALNLMGITAPESMYKSATKKKTETAAQKAKVESTEKKGSIYQKNDYDGKDDYSQINDGKDDDLIDDDDENDDDEVEVKTKKAAPKPKTKSGIAKAAGLIEKNTKTNKPEPKKDSKSTKKADSKTDKKEKSEPKKPKATKKEKKDK
ncbi:MAG: arginine--tRNA ligase [Candidatus Cloacimonas sp.]|nr:arginine--tRNA ligase [Candidatus Cloacimonadota bacterium]